MDTSLHYDSENDESWYDSWYVMNGTVDGEVKKQWFCYLLLNEKIPKQEEKFPDYKNTLYDQYFNANKIVSHS